MCGHKLKRRGCDQDAQLEFQRLKEEFHVLESVTAIGSQEHRPTITQLVDLSILALR